MPSSAATSTFAETLKEMRERRGATQAEVAKAVKVSRATVAQWESGRHLPAPDRAESLDEILDGQGALRQLVEDERRRSQAPGLDQDTDQRRSLLSVFRSVEGALEDHLLRDEDGQPLGWCQNQQMRDREPTSVSTAFGIKAVLLIEEAFKADLGSLGKRLQEGAMPDGGWAASSQVRSRPESIAVVIDAIVRVDPTIDVTQPLELLQQRLDPVTWQRPFIMTTVMETVLDLLPESDLSAELVRRLLASRQTFGRGGQLLWSEKDEPDLVSPEPSVLHTARSVCVLARARSMGAIPEDQEGEVDDALGAAVDWLRIQTRFENLSEQIARTVDGRPDIIYLRHFTPPLVARALLLAGEGAASPAVTHALSQMWSHYDHDHSLWRWRNGDLPIWMTFEAIAALRLAALAAFFPH
jgi:transcriptional regulator with XRE-family HTH domain